MTMDPKVTPERAANFLRSLQSGLTLAVPLSRVELARMKAHMDRVERDQPGLSFAAGEDFNDSLRVAIGALLDRALTESEADDGLRYDWMSGMILPAPVTSLRRRVRLAARVLRGAR